MVKVSVIVPVYNVEKYLKRCLDSLVNQTLSDIEIICVNDGSTDGSAQILEEYAKKDNRIKIITQVNSGLSEARNAGIKAANGEYIGLVDSDDFVDKEFYEKLYNAAISNNCDIACGNVVRGNDRKKDKVLLNYPEERVVKSIRERYEITGVPNHCYVWNKIYKREPLLSSGITFIRGIVYEDMPFTADVLESLGDLVVVPEVFYHYWINDGSIIKTPSDKNRTDKIFVKKYLLEKLRKYNVKLSKKDSLVGKKEYFFLGIKVLKTYIYPSTKEYYLFGLIPFLTVKEGV